MVVCVTPSALVTNIFTVYTRKQQHANKKIATIDRMADLSGQGKHNGVVHAESTKVFNTK